jgi:ankyrin repeat protein
LPKTLDETYERILQDIDEEKREFSHRLFQSMTVASRPFLVEELAEFLVFDFKAGTIPTLVEDWRPEDPVQAVLTTCSTLITIVDVYGSRVVQFSHFSVKEFLLSSRLAAQIPSIRRYHVPVTPAHTMVAQACLSTLFHLDENITDDSLKDFPLAEYALEHWMDHAQFDQVSLTLKDSMQRLFDPEKSHFKVWVRLFDLDSLLSGPLDGPSQPPETPLHFAASRGMCEVAQFLIIERSQDVNARRSFDNRTPLFIASERGHDTIARILLQHGAAANDHDLNGSTPLHLASERGHLEVARSLLIHGADSNSRDNINLTPLHSASLYGHSQVAEVLLEHGTRANPRDYIRQTPLHLASEQGHPNVSKLLLDRGADANARDKDGTTPLHLALQAGNAKMVQLLLSCGADPNTRGKDDQTALHLSLKYRWYDYDFFRCLSRG